jgi:hypothetical protein
VETAEVWKKQFDKLSDFYCCVISTAACLVMLLDFTVAWIVQLRGLYCCMILPLRDLYSCVICIVV